MITIKKLNYTKGKKMILKNISIHIRANKLTAIIGPNGSGKTTLLKHIVGNIKSHRSVFIEGRELTNISKKSLAQTITFVSQHSSFIAEMLVEDFVRMGRYPYKKMFSFSNEKDKKIVRECMQKFSLESFRKEKMGILSGGERKRAFLAKAFAQETDIIVLDEPINHLDIQYQFELMKLLQSFEKKTRICSLHDINLALRFCEDAILMKEGEVFAYGCIEEVLTEKNLESVFHVKTKREVIEGKETILFL